MNYAQFTPEMRPSVPIIFFIDRNFIIRSQYQGSEEFFESGDQGQKIRAEIDKLLAVRALHMAI